MTIVGTAASAVRPGAARLHSHTTQSSFTRPDSRGRLSPHSSILERVNPGHALPDDQRVHVVGAFVGLYRFQVHHVAHDGVVVGDAVGAQDIAGEAGALEGHPDVVALRHGDVLVLDLTCIFQATDLQHE